MRQQQNLEEMTQYLTQTLNGYEIISSNWGWHVHKGNTYCGHLEYQETGGWQGNAFDHLPTELKAQLKKFAQSVSSMQPAMI